MSTPPPRKRVSQACVSCGLKKVKCDGQMPTCSPCRHRAIDCVYGSSKRRARPSMADSPRIKPDAPYGNREDAPIMPYQNNSAVAQHQPSHIQPPILPPANNNFMLPQETSTRLLHTYFNCIHPLWPLLYKPMYASLNFGSPTDMMSDSLVAAIFAIAACVDKPLQQEANTIVQRYPDPSNLFELALDLLQRGPGTTGRMINALEPTINNCQVLTILALQQHGVAEYSRAAVLCGLASAMAIELRLHRAPLTSDGIQREIHSRLWWNIYILEKMMSSEMGRPVLLRLEETDCPFPHKQEADEFELMSNQIGSLQNKNASVKLRTVSGLHSTIKLSQIIERISREIYGISARIAIREDQAAGEAKRIELWNALQDWTRYMGEDMLKLDLGPDLTSVPASVTNYVIHWHGTILIHRPFIARWASNPAFHTATNPQDVCLDAATQICMTLEKYFDRLLGLPCDMVFSVFLAASTFLYQSKAMNDEDPEIRRQLQLCIHWLSSLGKSWKSAGAKQKMLVDMYPHEMTDQQQMQVAPVAPGFGPPGSTGNISHLPPDDWNFLREFGDPSDDFYELDVQLRSVLDSGLSSQQIPTNFMTR